MEITSKPYIPNKRILQEDHTSLPFYYTTRSSIELLRKKRKEEMHLKEENGKFLMNELLYSTSSFIPIVSEKSNVE